MARVFLPFADATIVSLVTQVNAALTPLLTKAIWGVQVQAIDQARYIGREYQMVLTYDDGTAVLVSPYQVVGFEGADADDVVAQVNAWVVAHPAVWVSPVYTVALPGNRYGKHQAAILFYCADVANAATNWAANGGGGGGGGDHSLLINRDAVDQHPARAVNYDAITTCPDATTTVLDSVKLQAGLGAAVIYEFYIVDTANPDTQTALGRLAASTGPAGAAPAVSRTDLAVVGAGVPEVTLDAVVSGGTDLQFTATVAALAGGAKVAWRRVNMTAPI